MKIFLQCKSLLLTRVLEIFLQEYICNNKNNSNIIISDTPLSNNMTFLINDKLQSNLSIPFSKQELMSNLNTFYNKLYPPKQKINIEEKLKENINTKSTDEQIKELMQEYTTKLLKIVKEKK